MGAAAIAAIAQDFLTYIQHGDEADTMTGRLINRFETIGKAVKGLSHLFRDLGVFIGESLGFAVTESQKLVDNVAKLLGPNTLGLEAQGGDTLASSSIGSFVPDVPQNLSSANSFANTGAIPSITNNIQIDASGMDRNELNAAIDMRTGQNNADALKANSTGKAF